MTISGGYKNLRLKRYDYHNGWFFVTNRTNFGEDYLTNQLYQLARKELIELAKNTKGVSLDYFQIMPNHIHVILIFKNAKLPLPDFWRRFKAKTTLEAKRNRFKGKTLWQRNYFEHVIRNEKALQKIREYIQNNPFKENIPLKEIYEKIKL